jgi:hypothetical protein
MNKEMIGKTERSERATDGSAQNQFILQRCNEGEVGFPPLLSSTPIDE